MLREGPWGRGWGVARAGLEQGEERVPSLDATRTERTIEFERTDGGALQLLSLFGHPL